MQFELPRGNDGTALAFLRHTRLLGKRAPTPLRGHEAHGHLAQRHLVRLIKGNVYEGFGMPVVVAAEDLLRHVSGKVGSPAPGLTAGPLCSGTVDIVAVVTVPIKMAICPAVEKVCKILLPNNPK